MPIGLERERLLLQVPSQFFCDWLEEHYVSLIEGVLLDVTGRGMVVDYSIAADDRGNSNAKPKGYVEALADNGPRDSSDPHPPQRVKSATPPNSPHHTTGPLLNSRYTFDSFIKGESNQFARAAALAVANNPGGTSFNPLVIYGGVGLGKTHLIHAIGNHSLRSGIERRVLYVSSEKFTIDFVDAIQKDKVPEFSNYYRGVDLLIVDDIQFFTGKEKTQDIFFHTFNALHQLGKQIVLSCDRPPKELSGLNERLISRFQWGLTADIQVPDLETRIAILRSKSSTEGVELAPDVLEFIASNITSNIRELEGCLIGLLARSSLENRAIDIGLAKDAVRVIMGEVRTHITIDQIQRTVCEHIGIPEDLIRAKTRKQEIVAARQIAMYLCKELTNSSLKTIGLHFGGRDHSTVIHAYQTVEDWMKSDTRQKAMIDQLKFKLEKSRV